MYGWGCETVALWKESTIPAASLMVWIDNSIRRGIYTPGRCDIFISQGQRLKLTLCHESDMHVETTDPDIVVECVSRWLEKGYRVHRKRVTAGQGWKDVCSVDEALTALKADD